MKGLFPLFLFLVGCTCDHLSVRSEFVNHQQLASVRVGTPDPLKQCPYYGQRLILHWRVAPQLICQAPETTFVDLYVLFHNEEKQYIRYPIHKRSGDIIYKLMNCDFDQKQGILTYKVELISDGEVLERWTHHTWAEWIDPDNAS